MLKTKSTGDMAELEHAVIDSNLSDEHHVVPSINSSPDAKSLPIVPPAPARNGSTGLVVEFTSRRRPSLRTLLMAAGILVVLVGSVVFWLRGGRYASTDDAYVQAAKVLVTTDVSGLVKSVNVREGQAVKAGDLLFGLDPLPFQIALDGAKANLREI